MAESMNAKQATRSTDNRADAKLDLDALVERAARYTYTIYEGKEMPHRSCGISIAETFRRPTPPYQALRKGGLTGEGQCGAIKGGELVLGEIFGDPDPTGAVTDQLRRAILRYRELWQQRVDKGNANTIICNDLTGQFESFASPERHHFCTEIASTVSACVATVLLEEGLDPQEHIKPLAEGASPN